MIPLGVLKGVWARDLKGFIEDHMAALKDNWSFKVIVWSLRSGELDLDDLTDCLNKGITFQIEGALLQRGSDRFWNVTEEVS